MPHEALRTVAQNFLSVAALHHLAIAVVAVLFWIRRRDMERTVAVYFGLAFGTTAWAMATHPSLRAGAVAAAVLAALWLHETVRPANVLSFKSTPRPRLVVMAALALFGLIYPGYSGDLPSFVFSPFGVLLPPTLIVALATLNCAAPQTNRKLHWSTAVAGLAAGVVGIVAAARASGPFTARLLHVPLLAAAIYAVPLLTGRAKTSESTTTGSETSVRVVTDRIHSRRVLMTRARRTSVRRLDIRKSKGSKRKGKR